MKTARVMRDPRKENMVDDGGAGDGLPTLIC